MTLLAQTRSLVKQHTSENLCRKLHSLDARRRILGRGEAWIHWISSQYLTIADKSNTAHIPDENLQESKISVDFPSGLLHPRKGPNVDKHGLSKQSPSLDNPSSDSYLQWESSTWFSSLWTLQEVILCPRIELCSTD